MKMNRTRKSSPIAPIELLETLTNIYDEEAYILRDHTGTYIRYGSDRQRVNVPSYNHAVSVLYKLGYRF